MNTLRAQNPRWLPTQTTVREMLAPCLVFIVACLDRQFQTDFWMHLARGGEIVRSGDFVTADHFTIAGAGEAIRDPNWLSQVFYYRLFTLGGLPLIQTCNALILAGSIWLLIRLCRRNGASSRAAGAAGVIAFLVAWQTFLIRPQTFSMLLFVLLYSVVSRPGRMKLLIWPPAIMLLWVNLHGGFLIGLVLIGVCAAAAMLASLGAVAVTTSRDTFGFASRRDALRCASRQDTFGFASRLTRADAGASADTSARETRQDPRWLISGLALSALATLANPSGWRVYQYAFSLTARVLPRHVEEWLAPSLHQWIGQALLASGLLIVVLSVLQRRRPALRDCLLVLCFSPLAMHSVRMVIWWAIVSTPIIAALLEPAAAAADERKAMARGRAASTAFCAVLLGMSVLSLPSLEKFNPIFATIRSPHRVESDIDLCTTGFQPVALPSADSRTTGFPVGAAQDQRQPVAFSSGALNGIFTRLEWGQYLDWKLGPQHRIFMDGHIELASDALWRDYCQITSGMPRWQELLDRYHINSLLLDRSYHASLLSRLKDDANWMQIAEAGDAVLLVRTPGRTAAHEATAFRPIVIAKEASVPPPAGANRLGEASVGADVQTSIP